MSLILKLQLASASKGGVGGEAPCIDQAGGSGGAVSPPTGPHLEAIDFQWFETLLSVFYVMFLWKNSKKNIEIKSLFDGKF